MDSLANGTELPNPFDEVLLHSHDCKNCGTEFFCAEPCDGTMFDPQLCEECFEVLGEIW